MLDQKLKDTLAEFGEEIKRLDHSNSAAKERLSLLLENIEQNLKSPHDSQGRHDLLDEMRNAVKTFEIKHPHIAGIVNEIIATLVNIGV